MAQSCAIAARWCVKPHANRRESPKFSLGLGIFPGANGVAGCQPVARRSSERSRRRGVMMVRSWRPAGVLVALALAVGVAACGGGDDSGGEGGERRAVVLHRQHRSGRDARQGADRRLREEEPGHQDQARAGPAGHRARQHGQDAALHPGDDRRLRLQRRLAVPGDQAGVAAAAARRRAVGRATSTRRSSRPCRRTTRSTARRTAPPSAAASSTTRRSTRSSASRSRRRGTSSWRTTPRSRRPGSTR